MPGSQQSIADCNVMLNTAVAESLKQFADVLENAYDFETALHELVKSTVRDHKRIIFNGNGYDEKWIKEATEKRGLLNLRTTPDALPAVLNKKNVDLLTSHNVMSLAEIKSRYEITLENYCKTVNIEGLTMIDMARKEILPAVESYVKDLSETLVAKTAALPTISAKYERTLIEKLSVIVEEIDAAASSLESSLIEYKTITDVTKSAALIRDVILQKWRNSALSRTRRKRSPQKNTGRSRRTTNFCSAYNSKPQTVNTHRIKKRPHGRFSFILPKKQGILSPPRFRVPPIRETAVFGCEQVSVVFLE